MAGRHGVCRPSSAGTTWSVGDASSREHAVELPAVPESAARARRIVRQHAGDVLGDMAAVDLAVTEAVANVIMHAYRDRPHGQPVGRIHVGVRVDEEGVEVVVADDGVGMAPRPDSPGIGLGMALIAHQADELDIEQRRRGTRLTMRFPRR